MKAIISVLGSDKPGIIAEISGCLYRYNVNILDITQTILPPNFFTMVMLVDVSGSPLPFGEIADQMADVGRELGVDIHAQREETFQAMHRI